MKPQRLALALAALALLPASASAKEVVKAQVCGADGCVAVSSAVAMDLADYGPPSDPPKAAAAFYTAEVTMRGGDEKFTLKSTFVPAGGFMRGDDGQWRDAPIQTEEAFKSAVGGLEPFPASELGPLPTPAPKTIAAPDPAPVDDGGSVWLIVAFGLAGVVATWGLVLFVRRRRGSEGSSPAAPTPPAG